MIIERNSKGFRNSVYSNDGSNHRLNMKLDVHPSDSTVSEDAGIELRTFAIFAKSARRSNP